MMVGTKAIATLSTGYLNALEYAKERVQGADLTQFTDKAAPRVTITHHPDVRRSLMTQKAYAEGMRALVLYTAAVQDEILAKRGRRARTRTSSPNALNDLLLPIVKGYGSEKAYELLAPVAADLRRLRLPAGVPDRAVHPGRQDRHPLRGHHRDPGPGLLLPQDRPRPGPGADHARRGDQEVRRRATAATARLQAERELLAKAPRGLEAHRRHDGRLTDLARHRAGRQEHLQGRPEHHPAAAGLRRRGRRLAAAAAGGRRRRGARRRAPPARTRRSTTARSPRRSSSPARSCRAHRAAGHRRERSTTP